MASRKRAPQSPPRPDVERVSRLRVFGVVIDDKLTAADHVTMLLSSSSSLMYAMRVLRAHSTPTMSLHDVLFPGYSTQRQRGREFVRLPTRQRASSLATASWKTARVLRRRRADRRWPIQQRHRRRLLPPRQTLTTSFSTTCLTRLTHRTGFASVHTTWWTCLFINKTKFLNDADSNTYALKKFYY